MTLRSDGELKSVDFLKVKHNTGYKLKVYSKDDVISCFRHEFIYLNAQGYTHVANMPGHLGDNIGLAKCYGITCIDSRLDKYIADTCVNGRIQTISDKTKTEAEVT